MCFALPLKVIDVSKNCAVMENGRVVDFSIVKKVKRGDWLLVQSNLAVDKLKSSEAKLMREAIKDAATRLKD